MMNALAPSSLFFTFLLVNILSECQSQNTQSCSAGSCDGSDWPSKNDLVVMIDQLRDHFVGSTDRLNKNIAIFQDSIRQLEAKNQQLEAKNQQLEAKDQQLENRVKLEQRSAFSAYMTVGRFRPVNETRIIVPFNGVDLNLGSDYNSWTSIYTCPVDGVYFFTYSIKEGGRDRTYATLVVDNKEINEALCFTATANVIACHATNSATINCNRGSTALIRTSDTRVQIYGTSSHDRTTFTGFLLYPN